MGLLHVRRSTIKLPQLPQHLSRIENIIMADPKAQTAAMARKRKSVLKGKTWLKLIKRNKDEQLSALGWTPRQLIGAM